RNDDQVARTCGVKRRLNGLASSEPGRRLAADGDGHGVDRLLAIGGRDNQLTALGGRAAVLRLLLYGAVRHGGGHGDGDRRVAPTRYLRFGQVYPADAHTSPGSAKAIVAGDLLLLERRCCGRGPGGAIIVHRLV